MLKQATDCIAEMKARSIKEIERKTKEHADLFGWQRLAHERDLAMRISESINLETLDQIFADKHVAEITETEQEMNEQSSNRMEIEATMDF